MLRRDIIFKATELNSILKNLAQNKFFTGLKWRKLHAYLFVPESGANYQWSKVVQITISPLLGLTEFIKNN